MHIKRRTIKKLWGIPKSGTKYLAVPNHNQNDAVPLVVIMREILGLVKTKKELKKIINEKKILVNGKIVKETNYPITLFDSLSIPSIKKYYKAELNSTHLEMKEIPEKEAEKRIFKIIGKKVISGKKVQINLSNGRNLISNEKVKTGDFVLFDTVKNKILKVISLEKNMDVIVIGGKHIGSSGKIETMVKEGENVIAKIKSKEGEISTNVDNLFAKE